METEALPHKYTKPVNTNKRFPDDVMTVEDFKEACIDGSFIDYDGHGYPVKDGLA